MTTISVKESKSEKYMKAYKTDSRLVKGKFFCHMPKGGEVTFPFRKYKEDQRVDYKLVDGQEYELPLGVVKHINSCGWEVHTHLLDPQGKPFVGTGKTETRFTFQSLDFI